LGQRGPGSVQLGERARQLVLEVLGAGAEFVAGLIEVLREWLDYRHRRWPHTAINARHLRES